MTEILTESFCERCGTRYTFESARPKTRLKGVKVFSRGLKNFVLSDDTTMDEAMAAARSETDREATSHQLDAFHKTFSFCMSCRQYTCPNCWNEAEARCLSCAPLALPERPAIAETEPFLVGEAPRVMADAALSAPEAPQAAEPYDDLRALRDALLSEAEAEPTNGIYPKAVETAAEAEAEAEVSAEADVVEAEAIAEPEAVAEPAPIEADIAAETPSADSEEAAGKAVSQTLGLLRRFRPGQSLDAELAAFERERAGGASANLDAEPVPPAAAPSDEPALASSPAEVQLDAEPQPETTVDALVEPEIEPAAAETQPARAASAEPEAAPAAAATADDVVEQPTWRITAPDPTTSGVPPAPGAGQVPLQSSGTPLQASATPREVPKGEPQWPARPEWPSSSTPAAGLPYLGRPATPEGGIEALWAASNQELVSAPQHAGKAAASSIQPCVSCGLSLSANARFCRRCGTLQSR